MKKTAEMKDGIFYLNKKPVFVTSADYPYYRDDPRNWDDRLKKIKAAGATDTALARLLLVVENYPILKADQTFLKLMDELSGTENRIAVERMRYNESVRDYNVTVRMFPGNLIAGMFGYKPATEYFKAEEKAKSVPEVKF